MPRKPERTVRITERLYEELELRADVTGERVNELVRRILTKHCEGPMDSRKDARRPTSSTTVIR